MIYADFGVLVPKNKKNQNSNVSYMNNIKSMFPVVIVKYQYMVMINLVSPLGRIYVNILFTNLLMVRLYKVTIVVM